MQLAVIFSQNQTKLVSNKNHVTKKSIDINKEGNKNITQSK